MRSRTFIAYHETASKFRSFDLKKTAQGIIWFTSDLNSIFKGETGASGHGVILKLRVTMSNPCGWKEYDQLLLDELQKRGYDGAILPSGGKKFDGFVFSPSQVKILGEVKVPKKVTKKLQYKGALYRMVSGD